jgi:hypothetical protein
VWQLGEKNSTTASYAGRKRRPEGLLGARVIAGPYFPEGYKYGGLALQIGGWTTGRQPVAVNKLTVRIPKPRLATIKLTAINLGSGKGLMR